MILEEQPIFPTFVCYTGDSLQSYEKVETTLYSDNIYFRGISIDFERSLPLSKINNIDYRNWREDVGLLFFRTVIPLLSIFSIFTYYLFQDVYSSLLTVIMIILILHIIQMGELNIIINSQNLPLIGKKSTLRTFWDHLERSLSLYDQINNESVGTDSDEK